MSRVINVFRQFTETRAFGVCTWLGNKMGIDSGNIRLSFIYLSFATFGSPILIYVAMAFILKHKHFFKPGVRRRSIWDI